MHFTSGGTLLIHLLLDQSWGITVCATILQNGLRTRLPPDFSAQFQSRSKVEIAYAAIPLIPTLPEPLKTEVKGAFADSMSIIWKTMIGFTGAGLLLVFLLKEIPMHKHNDERFTIEGKKDASLDGKGESGGAEK